MLSFDPAPTSYSRRSSDDCALSPSIAGVARQIKSISRWGSYFENPLTLSPSAALPSAHNGGVRSSATGGTQSPRGADQKRPSNQRRLESRGVADSGGHDG